MSSQETARPDSLPVAESDMARVPQKAGPSIERPGLRICPPYWHANRVNAKGRWYNREILELLSTEFRDRSVEYYVSISFKGAQSVLTSLSKKWALKTGATKINGEPASIGTIVRNGDIVECVVRSTSKESTLTPNLRRNMRHRHEPPITSIPIKIVHRDDENGFIVIDKPPSVVGSVRVMISILLLLIS